MDRAKRTSGGRNAMKRVLVVPLIPILVLAGCAGAGPKESGGTVVGGATGALIGGQFGHGAGRLVGVAIGAVAGGLIGGEIGRALDARDRAEMERSTQYALENSQETPWKNPETGNYGRTIPKKSYRTAEGRYCREYQQMVVIGGREQEAYGTACRQPDGSWKIVK
jgi:surface antigen